jgi:uncharacterized protein (TIGR01777 family)
LCQDLLLDSWDVVVVSRDHRKARDVLGQKVSVLEWDGWDREGLTNAVDGAEAIVNLAGESVVGLWTGRKRRAILESRVGITRSIVQVTAAVRNKPRVMIQGSAVGFYGSRGDEELDEESPAGEGFLANVATKWETAAREIKRHGVRLAIVRTGHVLGRGGLLQRLVPMFRRYVGGYAGRAANWIPWVHIGDETGGIRFLINNDEEAGVFNLTSPRPAVAGDFYRLLGKALRRPVLLRMPGVFARLLGGRMAKELLLSSQRVVPRRLLEAGYRFRFPNLEQALQDILSSP